MGPALRRGWPAPPGGPVTGGRQRASWSARGPRTVRALAPLEQDRGSVREECGAPAPGRRPLHECAHRARPGLCLVVHVAAAGWWAADRRPWPGALRHMVPVLPPELAVHPVPRAAGGSSVGRICPEPAPAGLEQPWPSAQAASELPVLRGMVQRRRRVARSPAEPLPPEVRRLLRQVRGPRAATASGRRSRSRACSRSSFSR